MIVVLPSHEPVFIGLFDVLRHAIPIPIQKPKTITRIRVCSNYPQLFGFAKMPQDFFPIIVVQTEFVKDVFAKF